MIGLAEIVDLGVALAKLGATPAVQDTVHKFLARLAGVSPAIVSAAVKQGLIEAEALPEPKE